MSEPISAKAITGQELFSKNCEICHTIGSGDKIGPDLNGVTSRREEEWLKSFILHPSRMIDKKDPIAMGLLMTYKIPMPERGLTQEEVAGIIKYLKSVPVVSVTSAETIKFIKKAASKENISKGGALFQGKQRFLHQGPSCISCHDVRKISFFAGGGLAKELTASYSRLGDAGISSILNDPPFPVMREAYANKELTNGEIAVLIDFLGNTDQEQEPVDYQSEILDLSIFYLVILFLFFYFIIWAVGK